jgi:hypothetical protein
VANEATIEEIAHNNGSEQEQTRTELSRTTEPTTTSTTTTTCTGRHIPIANDVIDKLLRPAIVFELRKRSLLVLGLKAILQARLKQGIKDEVPVTIIYRNSTRLASKKTKKKANAPKKSPTILVEDFPDGCYWKSLVPSSTAEELGNLTFNLARAPTVPEDEAENVTVKWNFAEIFERPQFLGQYRKLVRLRNGRQKKDMNGLPVTEF